MNILVIEDNPAQLKLAHHVLSAAGHHVNGIDAAERAFHAIMQDKPQIILLDLELPGMDGLTLVRKLKADANTKDIHIVAVTSFPEKWSRAAALEAGCDAYLVKPISTRMLPQQMADVLKSGSAEQT
jgi:CheY-like chemotaxis protein